MVPIGTEPDEPLHGKNEPSKDSAYEKGQEQR
jgi:hypothetical protein